MNGLTAILTHLYSSDIVGLSKAASSLILLENYCEVDNELSPASHKVSIVYLNLS
jgi:hypothetical protein